jgi:hypothetical protein
VGLSAWQCHTDNQQINIMAVALQLQLRMLQGQLIGGCWDNQTNMTVVTIKSTS